MTTETAATAKKQQADVAVIRLNESDPHLGDTVTFSYVGPKGAHGRNLRIKVAAYQNDVPFDYTWPDGSTHTQTDPLVYAETTAAEGNSLQLGGGGSVWLWHGGEANCVATLFEFKQEQGQQIYVPYADVSFHAAGVR